MQKYSVGQKYEMHNQKCSHGLLCLVGKEPSSAVDTGSLPALKDPLQKEMATCFQHSCLENPMDRGAWHTLVHGGHKTIRQDLVTKKQQQMFL